MCGICGFISPPTMPSTPSRLIGKMIQALRHRGPDGHGTHITRDVTLGHSRLSIIDLEGGGQPLYNEDTNIVLVCNGEIYNHKQLRKTLRRHGHIFSTASDCETIIHLWEEKGEKCVDDLRGMFAFALYDHRQNTLFCARDRFGQKPFFYYHNKEHFAFASEIKALLHLPFIEKRLNKNALDQFLFYQYVPHPNTLFQGVRQLPAGCRLVLRNNSVTLDNYYTFPTPEKETDADKALSRLEETLKQSVACHLESDVPVGLFLSGGIDSTLIGALAVSQCPTPLKSFCISFPGEKNDEARFARQAADALKTEHLVFPFQAGELEKSIERLIRNFDQPLADPAALPLSYLSKLAAEHVKVVLTGDGGDELFAGYQKYHAAAGKNRLRLPPVARSLFSPATMAPCAPDPLQTNRLRARLALHLFPATRCEYYKNFWEGGWRHALYSDEMLEICKTRFETNMSGLSIPGQLSELDTMLLMDRYSYLPDDLLLKSDYATMLHGLESRAPFLDHHVAHCAATLPEPLLVEKDRGKVALRLMLEKFVPKNLVERPKRGFSVPVARWFREELHGWVKDTLIHNSTTRRYFRKETVERVIREHVNKKNNHASKIYTLLVFEFWHRTYFGA